jgi:NAD-dependent dihydropyrimidine dehydrogenase PreA subunit
MTMEDPAALVNPTVVPVDFITVTPRAGSVTTLPNDELPPDTNVRPGFDPERARAAARRPDRPGERCRATPGAYQPHVDRSRCEGKADCVAVCPYDVFEVRRMADQDFRKLSLLGRLKSIAHQRRTAYTPNADLCRACGLCVVACPEKAIELVRGAE